MSETSLKMPDPIERSAYVEITLEVLCQRLNWLREFQGINGFVPPYRTIAQGWKISSSAIKSTLNKMIERGWIKTHGRNIVLTGDDPCNKSPVQTGEGWRKLKQE